MNTNYVNAVACGAAITPNDLAASVLAQVCADPTLEPHVRRALLGTAADLIEHSRDCANAEVEVACMLERMGCGAINSTSGTSEGGAEG
jgi:hypothetical protein